MSVNRTEWLSRADFTPERIDEMAAQVKAQGGPPFLSHEEREADRRTQLEQLGPGEDLWVFAYGSLIWNPAIRFVESAPALVHGFHRRFCFWITLGRGSKEMPGLMLGLDRGGCCSGIAYRIRANEVEQETNILWMREKLSSVYLSRWVRMRVPSGVANALTFVVNREHPLYTGRLDDDTTAYHLANARGQIGSTREYLDETVSALRTHDVRDRHLERLHQLVKNQSA